MKGWINARLEKASWRAFFLWFVLLMGYSFWAFTTATPWTRALKAAGGKLPETQPGMPALEPARSLTALRENDAVSDYLLWQILDAPYIAFTVFVASTALAIGVRALKAGAAPMRFLIALPLFYLLFEFIENSLLAGFASNTLPLAEPVVFIQQTATTLKFVSGQAALLLGLIGLLIAVVLGAVRKFKKAS